MSAELRSIRDFIRYGITRFEQAGLFYGHGTDNALDEATQLVLHVLRLPHDLPGHFMEARLTADERRQVLALIERRIDERIPLAYLTHEAWFAGLKFYVDERVLIPRSPIAELIEQGFEPWLRGEGIGRILDLCTGSGCIAIACAHAFPQAQVDAADISEDALAVAARNVAEHGLEERVRLVRSDLFSALAGCRYDLIVTNPPYVDAEELAAMPPEYRHEPELGLASGPDGLEAIETILRQAADHLTPDGVLIAEVGASEPALARKYPELPLVWLEFERGGGGVFQISRRDLEAHRSLFS